MRPDWNLISVEPSEQSSTINILCSIYFSLINLSMFTLERIHQKIKHLEEQHCALHCTEIPGRMSVELDCTCWANKLMRPRILISLQEQARLKELQGRLATHFFHFWHAPQGTFVQQKVPYLNVSRFWITLSLWLSMAHSVTVPLAHSGSLYLSQVLISSQCPCSARYVVAA